MLHRSFRLPLAALSLLAAAATAWAEDARPDAALTEAEVIRLAALRAPSVGVAQASDALAAARAETAGLFPNPTLSWNRETVETGLTGGRGEQDIFSATVPIDVAGPLSARALAASQSAWMQAQASLSRTDALLAALLSYYDVALAEARVGALTRSAADLDEAARVLGLREAAGAAAGYEQARLAVARELVQSRLTEARGAATSAAARLAGALAIPPPSVRVSGALSVLDAEAARSLVERRASGRAALRHAERSREAAETAGQRADWTWLPTLRLTGGLNVVSNLGGSDGFGYVLGASLGLPIFDRGQAARRQAEAQRALASARADALTRAIEADIRAAFATYAAARTSLERFDAGTSSQVDLLLTAARSGYREGERTIVELLDAQRAQADVALRRAQLIDAAKRAEARLRAATGDLD